MDWFLARIFDQFFTTKRVGKGTGWAWLRASFLCSVLVAGIEVASVEDDGSTFTVTLPINL